MDRTLVAEMVFLFMVGAVAFASPASGSPVSTYAAIVADTMVDAERADENFGAAERFEAIHGRTAALFRFDMTHIGTGFTSAHLIVHSGPPPSEAAHNETVFGYRDANWTDSEPTWSNVDPALRSPPVFTQNSAYQGSGNYTIFTVTSWASKYAGHFVAFWVEPAEPVSGFEWISREGGHGAQLMITYGEGAYGSPTTPTTADPTTSTATQNPPTDSQESPLGSSPASTTGTSGSTPIPIPAPGPMGLFVAVSLLLLALGKRRR